MGGSWGCLKLDIRKAVDSVGHAQILQALLHLGANRLAYCVSRELQNSCLHLVYLVRVPLHRFEWKKRVRQGSPLSGLLFSSLLWGMSSSPFRTNGSRKGKESFWEINIPCVVLAGDLVHLRKKIAKGWACYHVYKQLLHTASSEKRKIQIIQNCVLATTLWLTAFKRMRTFDGLDTLLEPPTPPSGGSKSAFPRHVLVALSNVERRRSETYWRSW